MSEELFARGARDGRSLRADRKHLTVLGSADPAPVNRSGNFIKLFPGGEGRNNCPKFWYLRDGFGCAFDCTYCYLKRFDFRHPDGAEVDPNVDRLLVDLRRWLSRPGELALILGEVSDAFGWAAKPWVLERNIRIIENFRAQSTHTLITLTKSQHVSTFLKGVEPTDRVVLSWSMNAPEVAAEYERRAPRPDQRLKDAIECRKAGWRVRVRLDPMIPIPGWQTYYARFAERIASELRPEQVTCGSWRPRRQDPMYRDSPEALRAQLELGPDRRFRLSNRIEMYRLAWQILVGRVPQLALCKEEFEVQDSLYAEFGVKQQSCNCLGKSVEPVRQPSPSMEVAPAPTGGLQ